MENDKEMISNEQKKQQALAMVSEGAVSVTEAEIITGFGRTFLYEAMKRGDLPYIKIRGSRRIPRRALEMWMVRGLMVGNDRVLQDGSED